MRRPSTRRSSPLLREVPRASVPSTVARRACFPSVLTSVDFCALPSNPVHLLACSIFIFSARNFPAFARAVETLCRSVFCSFLPPRLEQVANFYPLNLNNTSANRTCIAIFFYTSHLFPFPPTLPFHLPVSPCFLGLSPQPENKTAKNRHNNRVLVCYIVGK